MSGQAYEVAKPHVIHETVEGEVIVINLDSGNYYSLRGPGAVIWQSLSETRSVDSTIRRLRSRFDVQPRDAEEAVHRLIDQLLKEGLVSAASEPTSSDQKLPPEAGTRLPWEEPSLETFDDMQDLILLDPVHEVDDTQGWPHQQEKV
jgi:hypothetical protein